MAEVSEKQTDDNPETGWARWPLARVPPEVERILASLPKSERAALTKVVNGWLEPAERFEAMREEVDAGEAPAYYVPSAEGIAVYQGMFGPNGELSMKDKALMRQMLTEIVSAEVVPPDEQDLGDVDGHHPGG